MKKPKVIARDDWKKLENILERILGNSKAAKKEWFNVPIDYFDGKTPKQVIQNGELKELIEFFEVMLEG
jgi:hypothetical protein